MSSFVRARLPRLVAVASMVALAACLNDDPTPRPVPTFTRMQLTFTQSGGGSAPQTIEIDRATKTTSGALTVPASGGTIVARFLNADGTEDEVLQKFQPEYETRIFMTSGTNVTFSRSGANTLVATRQSTGTGTARVQLYDLGKRVEFLGADMTVNTP